MLLKIIFRSSPPEVIDLKKRCSENMEQIYRRIVHTKSRNAVTSGNEQQPPGNEQ